MASRNERSRKGDQPPAALALLNATAELLSEVTTVEVSLSDIAHRSQINSAMIKYYFGNKEGLLLALLQREGESAIASLVALSEMDMPADKKLRLHIVGIIETYYKSPYVNRLIHYLVDSGSPEASRRVTEIFIAPMIAVYRKLLTQGVDEGAFADVDPILLYYCLAGAADHIFHAGYSVQATLGVDRLDEELKQKYADLIGRIFSRGLAP